jgi:hypothetical protein
MAYLYFIEQCNYLFQNSEQNTYQGAGSRSRPDPDERAGFKFRNIKLEVESGDLWRLATVLFSVYYVSKNHLQPEC